MKLAIVSEWTADEAALEILLRAIVNQPLEFVVELKNRPGGWTHLEKLLPKILLESFYNVEIDGLIVVLDSDNSPCHSIAHEAVGQSENKCRLCRVRAIADQTFSNLSRRTSPRAVGKPLQFACGLAVPSIEAWCLCGMDHSVSEATINNARKQGKSPYQSRDLKRRLYGDERAPVVTTTRIMCENMQRLANAQGIELLRQTFPDGFGALVRSLQSWLEPTTESESP